MMDGNVALGVVDPDRSVSFSRPDGGGVRSLRSEYEEMLGLEGCDEGFGVIEPVDGCSFS